MKDQSQHDDRKPEKDDLLPAFADQKREEEHTPHRAGREHVSAWRREFNSLTNHSCCGPDGQLDFDKVKAWQMAHQMEATGTIRRDTIEMARAAADAHDDAQGDHSHKHHGKSVDKLAMMPLPLEWTDYLQRHPGVPGLKALLPTLVAQWQGGELDELEVKRKWHACVDFSGALPKHKSEVDGLWQTIQGHVQQAKAGSTGQASGGAHEAHGGGAAGGPAATGAKEQHGGTLSWMEQPGQDHLRKDPEHILPYVAVNLLAGGFGAGELTLKEMEKRFADAAKFSGASDSLRGKAHSQMMEKAFHKMKDGNSPFADAEKHNPDDVAGISAADTLQMSPEQANLIANGGATAVEWAAANVLLPSWEKSHITFEELMLRFEQCTRLARLAKSDEKRIRAELEQRIKLVRAQRKAKVDGDAARARFEKQVMDEDDRGDA